MRHIIILTAICGIIAGSMVFVAGCGGNSVSPSSSGDFVYENGDAVHLAFMLKPTLLPDIGLYEQIRRDLAGITNLYPLLKPIQFYWRFPYGKMELIMSEEASSQIDNGVYHGMDSLNAIFGPINFRWEARVYRYAVITWPRPYNADSLEAIYGQAEGVEIARAPLNPGDGSRILAQYSDTDQKSIIYTYVEKWGDFSSGCIYRHTWRFQVDRSTVTLIEEFGDPLP